MTKPVASRPEYIVTLVCSPDPKAALFYVAQAGRVRGGLTMHIEDAHIFRMRRIAMMHAAELRKSHPTSIIKTVTLADLIAG